MKSKINPRFLFSSTFIRPIVAVLTLTAPGAFADTVNSTVDLRVLSGNSGNDTTALSLYNDGGNVQHTFLNFDLSSYSGNSITSDATLTLVAGIFGNFLTGVSLGTANAAWDSGTINYSNQPSLTAIPGATNPSGTFGSGDVTWNIPWYMVEKLATVDSGYNNGLGITSGVGSSQHFQSTGSGGTAPALTFSATAAASSIWTGGDGNWTDTANWAGSIVAEGIDQAATINGGAAVNITMDANRSVGALAFSGANHTISSGAGKLALNVTAGSPTISVGTGRIATIGATVVGIDGLTKTGAGTLALSGANTYTGATTLMSGVLSVATIGNGGVASGNLGSATNAETNLVFDGGTLQYTGSTATTDRNFTINENKTAIFDISVANLSLTGMTPATNGAFTKIGAGTLTINAEQSYTGSTTINGGGLTITASGSITAASDIQVNSGMLVITDGGSGRTLANNMVLNDGVVQGLQDNAGTGGTITYSGGNVVHAFTDSGSLDLPVAIDSASQLIVGGGGGGGAGVSNNVYAAGGGGGQVLNLTEQELASGTTAVVVGAGGAGGANAVSGTTGGASSLGANTAAGGLGAVGEGTGGTSGSGNLGSGRYSGYYGGGGGGDSAAGASNGHGGAGTLGTITGSYYGGGGGGGSNEGDRQGGVGGGGNGNGSVGTANTGGGGGATGVGAAGGSGIVIVEYAYAVVGGGVVTLNGTVDLQSASTLDAYGSGGLLDVSGLISTSTGSGGLTIASSSASGGVVRFGSANSYLGNTTVNSGATLRMNTTNALPSGSGKGNLSLSGTLDLNGQATTSLNGLSGAGTIDNNTGAGTYALSVGNNNQTSAFGGVIQNTTGTLGLSKTGTGILTLSGTNTYSGDTTVNAGTLKLTSANANNQASTVTIATTGATLELDFGGTDTVDKLFIGATQMAPGVYKSSTNPGAGTAIPQIIGGGTLTVAPPSNYASWANDPSKGNIPGEPATGDFDNDGLTNLTEYALGKNPRTSSQPAGILSGNVITFTKGADAIANSDVSWVIETSTTLATGSWTPQVTQSAGDPAATISYTLTPASPAANFTRLKITQN